MASVRQAQNVEWLSFCLEILSLRDVNLLLVQVYMRSVSCSQQARGCGPSCPASSVEFSDEVGGVVAFFMQGRICTALSAAHHCHSLRKSLHSFSHHSFISRGGFLAHPPHLGITRPQPQRGSHAVAGGGRFTTNCAPSLVPIPVRFVQDRG